MKSHLNDVDKNISSVKNEIGSIENEKRVASQKVKDSMNKIREWIQMRENELLGIYNHLIFYLFLI